MLLPDYEIERLGIVSDDGSFPPHKGCGLSGGMTSYGYDARLAGEFLVMCSPNTRPMRPDRVTPEMYDRSRYDLVLMPFTFVLARTAETFAMPDNVSGRVMCKSTWARLGLFMPPTVLEPGWEGTITLELFNVSPRPIELWAGDPIAQIQFEKSYKPRRRYVGKYQGQTDVTPPRAS